MAEDNKSKPEKKLRIAMLGHKRIPSREGGIEIVVEELATRIVKQGYDVTCYNRRGHHVSGREFDVSSMDEHKGIKLKTVFTIDRRGLAAQTSSFFAAIKAAFGRYDIVHFHAEGPCAMLWLPKLCGKRCVATVHGLDWQREKWKGRFGSKYIKFGEKVAVKYADEIIVLSKRVQDYFNQAYGKRNGKTYRFLLAKVSSHKDKVVEIFPLTPEDEKTVADALAGADASKGGDTVIDGYVKYDGAYFKEYRPIDFSITKNVCALFICCLLVIWAVLSLVRFYRRNGMKAPRYGMGFLEMLIGFVYYDTIKSTLGDRTKKFAPYLLTCFFFILTMNLVGLIVVFPGGANLTGNIAITAVLAVLTFLMTNILGTKHYWKEIFWPDVPIWLKFPLPIMQMIEVFGIFTKPAALCVRLFANMMGGHMIVITLTVLIFIFAAFGAAVAGASSVVAVLFSLFMLALDVLVSFIQAYVFTLLSAMFISMAQVHEEESELKHDADNPEMHEKVARELAHEKAVLARETPEIETV